VGENSPKWVSFRLDNASIESRSFAAVNKKEKQKTVLKTDTGGLKNRV